MSMRINGILFFIPSMRWGTSSGKPWRIWEKKRKEKKRNEEKKKSRRKEEEVMKKIIQMKIKIKIMKKNKG